jgi:hypothetical protein
MTLTRAVSAFLTTQLLATIWAVAYRLPYEFGGHGAPDQVLRDFWSRGTALSAPAPLLAVLGLLSLLARRQGPLGTSATAILLVVMCIALVAGALEPAVYQALRGGFPPLERAGIFALTVLDLIVALLVIIVAGGRLRDRMVHHGAPGAGAVPNQRIRPTGRRGGGETT